MIQTDCCRNHSIGRCEDPTNDQNAVKGIKYESIPDGKSAMFSNIFNALLRGKFVSFTTIIQH